MDFYLPMMGRLAAALLLGGLVGYQRERRRHPAGLRTHMLVALGSALITIVSESYYEVGADPTRISAQIVSGIGFLGAGTIIRHGPTVRGLTTAASLWTVAGIGIGVGRGGSMLWLTAYATILVLITLVIVDIFEDRYLGDVRRRNLTLVTEPDALPRVLEALVEAHITIFSVVRSGADVTGAQNVYLYVKLPARGVPDVILQKVVHIEGVRAARWEESQRTETDTDA